MTPRKKEPETVSEQLRAAIHASGLTMYRIAKDGGLDPASVARFLDGADLRSGSLDKICTVLGLELRPKGE